MPGERWLSFARAWLDDGTVEHTIVPLIADWQHELTIADGWQRWSSVARGHLALARAFTACALRDCRQPLPQGAGATAWLVPRSADEWRRSAAIQPRPAGARELTLTELLVFTAPHIPERERRREAHSRAAVIVMPLSMVAFGFAAARRGRRAIASAFGWWLFAAAIWFSMAPAAAALLRGSGSTHLAPWAAHLALLILSGALGARWRHEERAHAH